MESRGRLFRNVDINGQPTTSKGPEERRPERVLFLSYFSGNYTTVMPQRNFRSQEDCKWRHFLLRTI